MNQNSIFTRGLKSLRNGSLVIKILNRFSRIKYAPENDQDIDEYFAEHYRGDNIKKVSLMAKKVWVDFSPFFTNKRIHTIAYVGAHDGTMALALNEVFQGLTFYLFEPMPDIYEKLVQNVNFHSNMHCINCAAGDKEEMLDMYVDNFSLASSILPYESTALQEYPFLGEQKIKKINVNTLDKLLQNYGAGVVDLLIMDVQGYEDRVLLGARQTLKACKVVISELSLQSLYRESSTFNSVYQALISKGFRLEYLFNPMKGKSQTILQIDGVFIRE